MVFGSTFCPISHLEIKDGDRCVLIPLGFRMCHEFDKWNKPDVNFFVYLHTFIKPAVYVIYGGNVSMITYAEDTGRNKQGSKYDEYCLYMLIHEGFFHEILNEVSDFNLKTLNNIPLFNTTWPIWEEGKDLKEEEEHTKYYRYKDNKISKEEYEAPVPTPEWMIVLFKVATFMGKMGIPPHPIFCNDQRETSKTYEAMRNKFLQNGD